MLVFLLVVSNLILIPKFGIVGAAIGSAGSLTLLNIFRYLFLYFKFKLQPYNIRFIFVILIGIAAFFVAKLIPVFSNFIFDLLIRSAVLTIVFSLPIYFFKISEDINTKSDEVLRLLKIKK